MQSYRTAGFSLIEILVAVAIMGILAAVAVPSYTNYVMEARRIDAHVALRDAAQRMERCRTETFTYVGCNTGSTAVSSSPDGYYSIAYSDVAANTFTVTATPVASTSQSGDTACQSMSVNQTGQPTSFGPDSSVSTADECW